MSQKLFFPLLPSFLCVLADMFTDFVGELDLVVMIAQCHSDVSDVSC